MGEDEVVLLNASDRVCNVRVDTELRPACDILRQYLYIAIWNKHRYSQILKIYNSVRRKDLNSYQEYKLYIKLASKSGFLSANVSKDNNNTNVTVIVKAKANFAHEKIPGIL